MRYLSLFSGIEAASVAWHPLGWECVGVAEVEPFPCQVLAHHYPTVPNLGSVTDITREDIEALGHIDVVVFGSPCQDLSVAGHRKGLLDANGDATRSGLFFTAINICHWSGARFWLWENVPGAFSSSKGRDFASVVEWMAGLDECPVPPEGWGSEGVALGTNGLLEWATLDAQWFGVAQRRRRVFALLDTGDWANRPPILLEPESLRGDSAPSRQTGEKPTTTIAGSSNGGGANGPGRDVDSCDSLQVVHYGGSDPQVADTVTSKWAKGSGGPSGSEGGLFVAHTLRGSGFDASEDGTGRGTPLVPVAFSIMPMNSGKDYKARETDIAQPLMAGGPVGGNQGGDFVVAFPANLSATQHASAEDLAPSMGAKNPTAVAFAVNDTVGTLCAEAGPNTHGCRGVSGSQTMLSGYIQPTTDMQVRRLTPRECERLQGFPDDYTLITVRGKPAADGPRYKALGNSMAVPVMHWIGQQIDNAANLI